MRHKFNVLSIILCILMLTGCASTQLLKKRAAFDLDCTEDQLTVSKLGPYTAGVEGCGKKSTYILQGFGVWEANNTR